MEDPVVVESCGQPLVLHVVDHAVDARCCDCADGYQDITIRSFGVWRILKEVGLSLPPASKRNKNATRSNPQATCSVVREN